MKSRTLVSGDYSTNIQAEKVELVFPDLQSAEGVNHTELLDLTLSYVGGLKSSSFLREASSALEYLYRVYKGNYRNGALLSLQASLTEELALTKMDLGEIRGGTLTAVPLFLEASSLWRRLGNTSKSLFSFHMLGVCSGIVGMNKRAIAIYRLCLENIPSGKRYEPVLAHVSRDLGIALNRAEMYEEASVLLNRSIAMTRNWNSQFNFGLDAQKLAMTMAGLGQFDKSIRLLDEAEYILNTKDDLSYVKNLNAKHFFSVKIGDVLAANELKEEILEICQYRGLRHQGDVVLMQDKLKRVR